MNLTKYVAGPTIESLIKRVDKFCARHNMTPSRFGRNACGNPNAVFRLKAGSYSAKSVSKIEAYLEANR